MHDLNQHRLGGAMMAIKRYLGVGGLLLLGGVGGLAVHNLSLPPPVVSDAFAQTTGGLGPVWTGTTAGGPTAYTLTPTVKGFQLRDGVIVRAKFNATNTGAATLNVSNGTAGTGVTAINTQNLAGISALVGGELVAARFSDLQYNAASSSFVLLPFTSDVLTITSSPATITALQWSHCVIFVTSTSGLTITLPAMSTVPYNGCIKVVNTGGVQVALQPNAADGINGGTVNVPVNLPADGNWEINQAATSGTGAVSVALGPLQYRDITWAEGLNLNAAARFVGRFGSARTVLGMRCNVQTAAGGTNVMHFWSTASGTAPASGTQLDSTGCNLNSASNTEQDMVVNNTTIVSGYTVWAVFSGAQTVSNGGATLTFR